MLKDVTFGLVLSALACGGCSGGASGAAAPASAEEEVDSARYTFFVKEPLEERRLETLRRTVEDSLQGYAWVQNQGTVFSLKVQSPSALGDLDPRAAKALAQAAFTFHVRFGDPSAPRKSYLHEVAVVDKTVRGVRGALDEAGLAPDDIDTATARARKDLEAAFTDAVAGGACGAIVVLEGSLSYQPDMSWENAVIVLDAAHGEVLGFTGGFGT